MHSYQQLLNYLYTFIPERTSLKFSGIKGIYRTKYLLKLLNNPQEKLRVVHVAGTSGKGSTSYLISILLKAHGFKTGLQVSPHLVDIRERFQINNQFISQEKFVATFQKIRPTIEKAKETEWGRLTYFEILTAFTFYYFWQEKVDFCVMETGLGGLYDGTNVVGNPDKLAVITRIGLDHQWILGKTLSAIAAQKAGIIQKGNEVVTIGQKSPVMKVFEQAAKKQDAKLHVVQINKNLQLSLVGDYQKENASLALAAVYLLSKKHHYAYDKIVTDQVLSCARFPGRFEVYKTKYRQIIIDGAHNPQKMKAFTESLKKIYPGQTFDFLLSFSRSKDQVSTLRGMLRYIVPPARKIYVTDFQLAGQDLLHQSVNTAKIVKIIEQLGHKHYKIIANDRHLLDLLKVDGHPLVITGSLYFIGSIYQELKNAIMQK